ncbi:hypothetical protein IW15_16515 [Chryseobacterium soli]|uniref:Uncharacterized protein n=1 Tax=Chryseobacterium soli TaxID=445961 RepID=A0A086A3T1_9FLAO|nr:hypothetical protein [Chryseobacterium soli]KFF11345.1 hypothetical protein IW15_16515 [Chryseobacterium soli]
MKIHLKKFNEIQNLLQLKLGAKVKVEEENGSTFLSIKDSNLWLSVDHSEFTVGFGLNHTHFSEEYGNLQNGIRQVFDLLTSEVRVTKYIKGETVYKAITEIKTSDSNIENLGITGILIYPFWKKTRIETSYFERIINRDDLIPEIDLILR